MELNKKDPILLFNSLCKSAFDQDLLKIKKKEDSNKFISVTNKADQLANFSIKIINNQIINEYKTSKNAAHLCKLIDDAQAKELCKQKLNQYRGSARYQIFLKKTLKLITEYLSFNSLKRPKTSKLVNNDSDDMIVDDQEDNEEQMVLTDEENNV